VRSIDAVSWRYGPQGGKPLKGSGVLSPMRSVSARSPITDEDLRFQGYLVALEDVLSRTTAHICRTGDEDRAIWRTVVVERDRAWL